MGQETRPLLTRGALLGLIALFALLWFAQIDIRHLISSDEGRYAEMAREMFVTGDWITPRYNGYKYFEKPPLQIWMTALSFTLFGIGDWQARLWTALSGFIGVLAIGFAGARVFNPLTGLAAALVLASAPYWNLMGHFNSLDMGLSSMMCLTLAALLLAQRPGLSTAATRGWMWLCWAAMALAVLSKGLIGIVLPGAVLVLYSLVARDVAVWRRLYLLSGLLVFLLICAPWFVAVQKANPEFFDFFFVREHFRRFLTDEAHREGPLWYFVPVLLAGFLPWLGIVVQSVRQGLAVPRQTNQFSPVWLLIVWTGFIFVFFSVSHSKLVSYVLPVAPSIALLIGLYLPMMTRQRWRRQLALYTVVLLAAVLASALVLARMGSHHTPNALYRSYAGWTYLALALALLGVALSAWLSRRRAADPPVAAIFTFALGWFLAVSVAGNAHEVFGRDSSGIALVPAVRAEMARAAPGTPFYGVDELDHTIPFYVGHPLTMVAHRDELAFGIEQEPAKWFPTINGWRAHWQALPQGFALMRPDTYAMLCAQGVPMRVVAQDLRRVIVARH